MSQVVTCIHVVKDEGYILSTIICASRFILYYELQLSPTPAFNIKSFRNELDNLSLTLKKLNLCSSEKYAY